MQAHALAGGGRSRRRLPVATRVARAIAVGVALSALPLVPGDAQQPPADPGAIQMRLAAAPVGYGPGDRLRIRLRISNGSDQALENARIRVGVRDRALSRSALQQSYEAGPGFESSALPVPLDKAIGPGETTDVVVNEPVGRFPTIAGSFDGGVFPATFSLQEETGATTFASLTIPLVYHPEPPEKPLDVHVLLRLDDAPSRAPSGSFEGEEGEPPPLVTAASADGWLDGYIEALEEVTRRAGRERRPLWISVAPTPRLLEELADLADGAPLSNGDRLGPDSLAAIAAGRALARLRVLFARNPVEPLLVPYASPDLPTLAENLPLRHMAEQLSAGEDVWDRVMEVEPIPGWVFPPGARLDAPTLEQLQLLRHGQKVILSEGSVAPLPLTSGGCPEPFLSFTCAVRVRTDTGPADALVADGLLQSALDALVEGGPEARLVLQRVFADTAMVHAELPGTEGRVLHMTIPARWHPAPRLARTLLKGLADAPWIRTRLADGALGASAEIVERDLVDRAPADAGVPDASFYEEAQRARELLDSYASMIPSGTPRLQRLRRNILVASSNTWLRRADEGERYLTGTSQEVEEEFSKVGVTGASEITLTSKSGPLQIVVSNETSGPARVALRFVSPDLRFAEERVVETYEPGNHALTLEPQATGSGVFQLVVRLETVDGHFVDEKRIVVRSTSFNQVALGLTVGAFAFVILFYVFKAVRGRTGSDDEASAGA